jgi:hypothetical protein
MRWVMRSRTSLAALAIAIWWVLVNLPWLTVGETEFTGGQLIPVLNLLPAIALTALFISMYGKLRKTLLIAVTLVLGGGLFVSLVTDLSISAVVISELERLSGILNPESHEAGVKIADSWAKFASIGLNSLAILVTLMSLRGKSSPGNRESSEPEAQDNRSLWDEQS